MQIVGETHRLYGRSACCGMDHIGGLGFNESGQIVPGRVVEETFWQPELIKY